MRRLLVSHRFNAQFGATLDAQLLAAGLEVVLVPLPESPEGRLAPEACADLDGAFFSEDVYPDYARQFFSTVRKAPKLDWLHVFNAGVDHPIYTEMLERGVRLTTSSGATTEPIAQTAIAGLLMLARNFPRWISAQAERRWDPARQPDFPRDLRGQTVTVLGLGHIGNAFARLARLLGLHVTGVRRGGPQPDDHVDRLITPAQLDDVLPGTDWLVVACPLTEETRGMVTADMLARLPRGAHVINVARGEIVDERALVDALERGHLHGAYLDVFAQEPLPPDSPLWHLPRVLISPHSSSAAQGNAERTYDIFRDNVRRWVRGEPLVNEVRRPT